MTCALWAYVVSFIYTHATNLTILYIITLEITILLLMVLVGMILINNQLLMEHKVVIPMDMINLLVATTLPYRGFGYYQYGVKSEQPQRSYFPNCESSSQSFQTSNE